MADRGSAQRTGAARASQRDSEGATRWATELVTGHRGTVRFPTGFAAEDRDREALAVLLRLSSLAPRKLLDLAEEHRSAARCLQAIRRGLAASALDQARARSTNGGELMLRVRECGARLVTPDDLEYPGELLDLHDPPAGMFVRGRELGELRPRVAIVGARNCSPAGRAMATVLARGLADAGACVVSGGARGIDEAGHQGALEAGGPTIAVLGSGIDVLYPPANAALLRQVATAGAILSEYPPGTRAEPFRFPARNRIVAALAIAVVVVEGARGSGSMITADHALDIGRDVFAVPGPATSDLSHTPHELIRDGAGLIRGPDDLLRDLGLVRTPPVLGGDSGGARLIPDGATHGTEESAVWKALSRPMTPDAIADVARLPLGTVISMLVGMELRRLVVQSGGRYQRSPEAG